MVKTDLAVPSTSGFHNSLSDIKTGMYLLLSFENSNKKKNYYRYVCIAQSEVNEDNELTVMGMKLLEDDGKTFKIVESDLSYVSTDQIISILPEPEVILRGDRVYFKFKNAVDVYEK